MSLFQKVAISCPSCGTSNEFEAVHSVNADRRPDLRESILNRSFQRQACTSCGKVFRLEPEFNYLHIGQNQWIAAFPRESLQQWRESEGRAQQIFDKAFGDSAPSSAQIIGDQLKVRVVFGWPALHEKLVTEAEGLDDVEIELLKGAILRGVDGNPVGPDIELRLVGADEDALYLVWLQLPQEALLSEMRVPRALYDEIRADTVEWAPLRAAVSEGLYVDLNRIGA